jgi:hypothetical protein
LDGKIPGTVTDGCAGGTDSSGQCVITINSESAGTFKLRTTVNTVIDGVTLVEFNEGTKTYVVGSLAWSKVDEAGTLLAGATFEACRVAERPGSTPPVTSPECVTVVDNISPDADPADGKFKLADLKLGTWEIRETVAPEGYLGEFSRLESVFLDLGSLDGTVTNPWVNSVAGKVLETGTICEDYLNGTAIELNDIIYRLKQGKINNVAPGVFFYYTTFTAPSTDFTVDILQTSSPVFEDFHVQNIEQVRLFNGDCTVPAATITSTINGQVETVVTGAAPNNVYIMSVKYETGNVVGFDDPGTIQYSYTTKIDGNAVDQNSNGLYLRKKGN